MKKENQNNFVNDIVDIAPIGEMRIWAVSEEKKTQKIKP